MQKQPKKRKRVPKKLRAEVLRRDNNRCQYPTANGICGSFEKLRIHDATHTGKHKSMRDCITLCETHHNQATADQKYAYRIMRDFQAKLKKYKTEQALLDFG